MEKNQIPARPLSLTPDSQRRLLAYSTAASLGAFFAGQKAEAALVQAPGLGSYPLVILPQPVGSANGTDHYLSIEGGALTNFDLHIGPDLLSHPTDRYPSQVIDLVGFVQDTNNPTIVNGQVLAPPMAAAAGANGVTNAYASAFLGGQIIGNNSDTTVPWYAPRLGLSYNAGAYPFINYNWTEVPGFPEEYIGFEFTSSVDGQNHFGYLDMQITFTSATIGTNTKEIVKAVTIMDCRYETTPNAGVTVPSTIKITSITCDPTQNNLITINFGPNWPSDASTYVLESSPTLGASAVWTTDPQAVVFQTGAPTSDAAATYQALTYPASATTNQFWRISKQ